MVAAGVLMTSGSPAWAAYIPGSGAPRNGEKAGGRFVVWSRPAGDGASCAPKYRAIPERAFVLDVRSLQVRALPRMIDEGYLEVTAVDRAGTAAGRLVRCSGDDRFGRVDLATGSFIDYASLPEAQPLPMLDAGCPECGHDGGVPARFGFDFDHVVGGEAIEIREGAYEPGTTDLRTWRVTRVDLESGRTRTTHLSRLVIDDHDELLRARNGDLVWFSARTQTPQHGDACSQPPLVRVWSYRTGALRTVRPAPGGYLPERAVARSGATCHGTLDPDSLRLYESFRRNDYVSWQLRNCRLGHRLRISLCGRPTNAYGAMSTCCLRLHDARSNVVSAVPADPRGRDQYSVTFDDDHVVWGTARDNRTAHPTGPLHATARSALREMSEITSVQRRGVRVTISWRTYGTRYNTRIVAKSPGSAWGEPRMIPITGIRVGARCTGPFQVRQTGSWNSDTLCTPKLPQRRGSVTFIDPPGRQTYVVDGGGYSSREIVL